MPCYIDTLSRLPRVTADDEESIDIRAIAELPAEVREELCQINEATEQGMPAKKNVVSMNEYSLDAEGRILVGPMATQHLM